MNKNLDSTDKNLTQEEVDLVLDWKDQETYSGKDQNNQRRYYQISLHED